MKKILFFVLSAVFCMFNADGAVRDTNTSVRGKNTTVATNKSPNRSISNRSATKKSVSARQSSPVSVLKSRGTTTSVATRTPTSRSATNVIKNTNSKKLNVSARAATQAGNIATETRTGAAYEQCKTAFFTCMDQFCELKNDNFRRCSCNDRVFGFQEISEKYQNVSEQLTEFSENLDVVGMTKEQATAMKTATEGEDALTEDKSASKQLLQAIMNAIKGEDSTIGGKYKDLNSITISPDTSFAFGMHDYGQIIASYNGTNLYKAVFPQCRNAVKADCNNASLQRAINAYLMAIEQDCNTVENALSTQRKALKASAYEGSAMLDLARVENRQNRNSDDIATCLLNVENAILSEEVCGSGYHKCLDDGQYIDVITGAPLTNVQDFYKLGTILTFNTNKNIQNQKLSYLPENKKFVEQFENKTKKFAKDALNKCTENADKVWQEYLDRALLDIYYAQQEKVESVRTSCLDLVNACYTNQNSILTEALKNLLGEENKLSATPATIELTNQICASYIDTCDNMFANDTDTQKIIAQYTKTKKDKDIEKACRAVVQQCFDNYGGAYYENFYSLLNGIITPGAALDWFTLYDLDSDKTIVSPCAKELKNTEGCQTDEIVESVFGGFDKQTDSSNEIIYGLKQTDTATLITPRNIRHHGVATEIHNKIVGALSAQCTQMYGIFVESTAGAEKGYYFYQKQYPNQLLCQMRTAANDSEIPSLSNTPFIRDTSTNPLHYTHVFHEHEYICPAGYDQKIDTRSWGICSCWENNKYRSKNGTSSICLNAHPIKGTGTDESTCPSSLPNASTFTDADYSQNKWCLK